MTDQTTPTTEAPDYLLGMPLTGALRDIAAHGVGDWDFEALADRASTYEAMAAGLEDDVEPAELTPVQDALLDALRDVATTADAPAAMYAGKEVARLAAEALGYPLPAPVEREGGVMGFLYGRPVAPKVEVQPAGVAPVEPLRRQTRATGGIVDPSTARLVGEQGTELVPDQAAPEPWPFKPGTVVRDEDGAEVEWLEAAPDETVVTDRDGTEWARRLMAWFRVGRDRWIASADLAAHGPITVVSVPDQEADRG